MAKRALKVDTLEPEVEVGQQELPATDEVENPEPKSEVKKMSFSIQKHVPIPTPVRSVSPARRKYPFAEMDVGDCFFIPNKSKNTISTHTSTMSKQLNCKFTTRMVYLKQVADEWVLAEKGEEGASLGIGVWRTE